MLFSKVGLLVSLAAAAVAAPVEQRALVPLRPSVDPFYQPPAGFESTAPGTVLKTRTIIPALLGLLPSSLQAYQLLYRTTSINGTAIATVTTVFKPLVANATLDKFVSFHTAEDSSFVDCAPSYNYQLLAQQTNAIVGFEAFIIQAYILKGYIVSSPDYESFDAAFGPGRLAGRGVLDSMRAVNNFATTLKLVSNNNAIVGIGYSGGAIATGWAAALHNNYAPELNIKGWSSGGTPANITGTALYIDNTTFSGFLPSAIVGLSTYNAYGTELRPVIDSIIGPKGREALTFTSQNCATANLAKYPNTSIFGLDFQSLGKALFYQPTIAAILKDSTLGLVASEVPIAPVNLYHAINDEIIPYANASTLYTNWCNQGGSVRFTSFTSGGHATTEIDNIARVQQFVADAFAGKVASGCSAVTLEK
ncbi:LIP-domain-containing protein [Dissoconium aciculare CBS 342.82]|uniref:LIP-domain-containing protein n=1 Tax=Dissoconium aciculare CBS 342.82 TaxID=1314786 RepID=A0A6J3MC15_9PEZI|nr:LIP-domain-containing protein [Dissoconium aciculare CBS 342.82]KAF1825149.1 LIP-domain-containing protein [Dissoconium aciculare CBS 342.82]